MKGNEIMKILITCGDIFQVCEIASAKSIPNTSVVGQTAETMLILTLSSHGQEYRIPMSKGQANGIIKKLYTDGRVDLTAFTEMAKVVRK